MTLTRVLGLLVFLSVIVGVLGGGHYYLARRLILDLQLDPGLQTGLLVGLVTLGASMILQPIAERTIRSPLARPLSWIASVWMGAAFVLLVLLGLGDLGLWIRELALGPAAAPVEVARLRALATLGVAGLTVATGMRAALRVPSVRRVEVPLRRWPAALDGFRIVQITDVHIGPLLGAGFARAVTTRANELRPDIVAVTGDLVDGSVAKLMHEVAPFGDLKSRHGVFFVTGNHDHYSGANAWATAVERLGMRVLRNESTRIEQDGASFDLAGVDDHRGDWVSGSREDLDAALGNRNNDRPVVLLAHDPTTFRDASRYGVDLQISGHTHGGQIFPFHLPVKLATTWIAGLYEKGLSKLYVSRGTGFWGPPMRIGAPPEITELVLRAG
jgi:predicted MPP superfamily phosphohydrolase